MILHKETGATWNPLTLDPNGGSAAFASDKKDNIHVAYATATELRYARVSAAGAITTELVGPSSGPREIRIDSHGTLRIFDGSTIFTRCTPSQWATAQAASPRGIESARRWRSG